MRNQIRPTISIIAISSLLLCFAVIAYSQPNDDWRRTNNRGNRYEGINKSIGVATSPIEIISFCRFRENFVKDETLKVKFYLHDSSDVYLTAQEIDPSEYYWMEAKPQPWKQGWNEFSPWPVSVVLRRNKIPAYNLGVLVRLQQTTGSGPLSPVIVHHSSLPFKIEQYTAYFRPGCSLDSVRYELYRGCTGNKLIQEGRVGRQSEEVPFPIIFDLSKEGQGLVTFRIIVYRKGVRNPEMREHCFYHVPSL